VAASGARVFAPFIHVERARVAALAGDATGRERELREALRLFREMGARVPAERVAREI
jgi:hypothetical protein